MSCNTIIVAITNRMPPRCFNCCGFEMGDGSYGIKGYCWIAHQKTTATRKDRPPWCPLIIADDDEFTVGEHTFDLIKRTKTEG